MPVSDISKIFPRVHGQDEADCRRGLGRLLGREHSGFPGAQPMTLTRDQLAQMGSRPGEFLLCHKDNGVRCLLIDSIGMPGAREEGGGVGAHVRYLLDRNGAFYRLPPMEEEPDSSPSRDEGAAGFVLDCELLIPGEPESQPRCAPHLIVFDVLVSRGRSLMPLGYEERRSALISECAGVWRHAGGPERVGVPRIELKPIYDLLDVGRVVQGQLEEVDRGRYDGLVFMRRDAQYTSGSDSNMYKWKSPGDNTVDFKLEVKMQTMLAANGFFVPVARSFALLAFHGRHGYRYYAPLYVEDEERRRLERLGHLPHGKIVECRYDRQLDRWRPVFGEDGNMLTRDDKKDGNHISVVNQVRRAIDEAVELHEVTSTLTVGLTEP